MSPADRTDTQDSTIRKTPHDALQVEDIIDQILLKLVEDENAKKADLLSMARCCKAFEDPSLNRLWASMTSVVPLLKLIHGVEESQGTLIIAEELEYGELPSRFHRYAKRIHSLDYHLTTNFANMDVSTWIRLAQLEGALLPNLTSLKISCAIVEGVTSAAERDKALLLLPALVRPSAIDSFTFQMVSVTSFNGRFEVGPFLSILSDYKLSIETLAVSGTFNTRYANTIAKMQSLRSVSIYLALDSAIPSILTALAALPCLHTLNLEFLGTTPSPEAMGTHSFQSLLKVALKGGMTFISRTLASITSPCMEHVDIQVTLVGTPAGTDVPPAQESVLSYLQLFRFSALKRIIIDMSGCSPPPQNGKRVNRLNFVAPILGNRRVEELVVKALGPDMCFSDHEITELATAWPYLRILRLEHTRSPAEQPSFASLDHLANRCPNLAELSLTLHENDIQDLDHNTALKPGTGVWGLNLQHTIIKQYAVVGRYLDELFPFLNSFAVNEEQARIYVQGIIFQACQIVRKSEQRRRKMEVVRSDIF